MDGSSKNAGTLASFIQVRKEARRWLLAALLGFVIVGLCCRWPRLSDFVTSVDHGPYFMQDFVEYYYPMGHRLIATARPIHGYYYTAFFGLWIVPLSRLEPSVALIAWFCLQALAIGGLVVLVRSAIRLSNEMSVLVVALLATAYPVLNNVKWGQVSTILVLMIIASALALRRGRPYVGGAILGAAAAVKYYPALFCVVLFGRNRRKGLWAFVVAGAVCYGVLPAVMLGLGRWLNFELSVARSLSSTPWLAFDINSQFAAHVVGRWVALTTHRPVSADMILLVEIMGYAIAFVCLGAAIVISRHTETLAVVPLFLALPFILKTSWPHYFSYLPYCQIALFAELWPAAQNGNIRPRIALLLVVLSLLLSSLLVLEMLGGWMRYNAYGILFLSNLILLVAFASVWDLLSASGAKSFTDSPSGSESSSF